MRDFTLETYTDLIQALLDTGYSTLTVREYLTRRYRSAKHAVIRHDVDRRPMNARRMAELEHALGIASTYYFRYPATFDPGLITQIRDLGHEIGYHYEVLAKTNGDYRRAIALFTDELRVFRAICDVQTICMHGSPLSRYDNRDLWKEYDFRDYGIEGEAYLSMAGEGFRYLTDTGRSWSGKHTVRDTMPDARTVTHPMETTANLIDQIKSSELGGLYLTVHPERWAGNSTEWVIKSVSDFVVNAGKWLICAMR